MLFDYQPQTNLSTHPSEQRTLCVLPLLALHAIQIPIVRKHKARSAKKIQKIEGTTQSLALKTQSTHLLMIILISRFSEKHKVLIPLD